MDKKAIFVVGPESSGTRMMTEVFIRLGFDGDSGHGQRWDTGFGNAPDKIAFRRSLPHAKNWPDITRIVTNLESHGYDVWTVFTWREPKYMIQSQVKEGHVNTVDDALENIGRALHHAEKHLENLDQLAYSVIYERWISDEEYRASVLDELELEPTKRYQEFTYYNGNKKYPNDTGLMTSKIEDALRDAHRTFWRQDNE